MTHTNGTTTDPTIGEAKTVLAEAVRRQYGAYRQQAEDAAGQAQQLAADCAGINGQGQTWRGIASRLTEIVREVQAAEEKALASLEGKAKAEVVEHVDEGQKGRVLEERAKVASNG